MEIVRTPAIVKINESGDLVRVWTRVIYLRESKITMCLEWAYLGPYLRRRYHQFRIGS